MIAMWKKTGIVELILYALIAITVIRLLKRTGQVGRE
jgi:hypothetical protein